MAESTASLKQRIADSINIEKTPELQRTLAVMPFLGTGMGSGRVLDAFHVLCMHVYTAFMYGWMFYYCAMSQRLLDFLLTMCSSD